MGKEYRALRYGVLQASVTSSLQTCRCIASENAGTILSRARLAERRGPPFFSSDSRIVPARVVLEPPYGGARPWRAAVRRGEGARSRGRYHQGSSQRVPVATGHECWQRCRD